MLPLDLALKYTHTHTHTQHGFLTDEGAPSHTHIHTHTHTIVSLLMRGLPHTHTRTHTHTHHGFLTDEGLPDFLAPPHSPVPLCAGLMGALLHVYLQGLWLNSNAPSTMKTFPLLFLSPLILFFSEVSFQLSV